MNRIEVVVMSGSSLIFGCGLLLAIFQPAFFHGTFIVEDGALEWMTVVAFAVSAAVSAHRLFSGYHVFSRMKSFLLLLIVGLALFGIGEELNWGQRLFGLEAPLWVVENFNTNEIGLHNVVVGDVKFAQQVFPKILLLFFLCYLGVLTPAYSRSPRIRKLADGWGIPIPKPYQVISYFAVIVLVEVVLNFVTDGIRERGELTEFMVSIIVALNIAFPRNQEIYLTDRS